MASIAALAAGCAGAWNGRDQAMTVAEEHPISVDSQTVTLTIDLDRSTKELTSVDKARLRAFADSYLTNGHGPLTVTAPSGPVRRQPLPGASSRTSWRQSGPDTVQPVAPDARAWSS